MCHSMILLAASKYISFKNRVPQFLREVLRVCQQQPEYSVDSISLLKQPENGNLLFSRQSNLNCIEWGMALALAMLICAQHLALSQLQLWGSWLRAWGICLCGNLSLLFLTHCLWCSSLHLVIFFIIIIFLSSTWFALEGGWQQQIYLNMAVLLPAQCCSQHGQVDTCTKTPVRALVCIFLISYRVNCLFFNCF